MYAPRFFGQTKDAASPSTVYPVCYTCASATIETDPLDYPRLN